MIKFYILPEKDPFSRKAKITKVDAMDLGRDCLSKLKFDSLL